MDAAEERLVNERMRQKLNEVNETAQSHLAGMYHRFNFDLQRAYFKCVYHCFDTQKRQDEIGGCVENCGTPLIDAQDTVQNQMADFQEKLNRSFTDCQEKYSAAKMLVNNNAALKQMESCVDTSIEDSIRALPYIAAKLKTISSMED